ncbi:restriction endonuclease, partial [Clostridium perfringens]|nr:restriction endonuclease [Clostridium perfringens]
MAKFKESISSYEYYIDFKKVINNVEKIKLELNLLNSLIGSSNIEDDFRNLVSKYPEVLKCIPILLAIRGNEVNIKTIDEDLVFNFKEQN